MTILIAKYPGVKNWLFKVDDEICGRGLAYFSLESIRVLSEIWKNKEEITEETV